MRRDGGETHKRTHLLHRHTQEDGNQNNNERLPYYLLGQLGAQGGAGDGEEQVAVRVNAGLGHLEGLEELQHLYTYR